MIVNRIDGNIVDLEVGDEKNEKERDKEDKLLEGKVDDKEDEPVEDNIQVNIGKEQAIEIAINFLIGQYGAQEYRLDDAEFKDGIWEIEMISDDGEFELKLGASDGRILEFDGEIHPMEVKNQLQISEEEASQAALQYLTERLGDAAYLIEDVDVKDGNYEVEISLGEQKFELIVDGIDSTILGIEMSENSRDEREGGDIEVNITLEQAIEMALNLLNERYGASDYMVEEMELEDGVYKIEIVSNGGEFEFEISASNGNILDFDGEIEDLEIRVENDDNQKLKIDVERRLGDGREGFKLEVEKEDAGVKLEFKVRDETKVELELKVQFGELIEFLDDGSQAGVYDSDDTIISIINLDELIWSVTRAEERDQAGALEMMLITQESSNDRLEKIALLYHLTPTSRSIDFGEEEVATVNIWEVKFDIYIQGYAWGNDDSMLALAAEFDTEFEFKDLEGKEVRFETVESITPFFNWGGLATADGSQIEVVTSVVGQEIVLTYPHFDGVMIHDPTIGYLMGPSVTATVLVPPIMAMGFILTTIVGVVIVASSLAKRNRVLILRD